VGERGREGDGGRESMNYEEQDGNENAMRELRGSSDKCTQRIVQYGKRVESGWWEVEM
jgi:hypothetical protein